MYVIAGPEDADGYAWYLVDPVARPCLIGCDDAPRPGWVAAASKDGERWLAEEPTNPECPEPSLEEIYGAAPQLSRYCFGDRELTLTGDRGSESSKCPVTCVVLIGDGSPPSPSMATLSKGRSHTSTHPVTGPG